MAPATTIMYFGSCSRLRTELPSNTTYRLRKKPTGNVMMNDMRKAAMCGLIVMNGV